MCNIAAINKNVVYFSHNTIQFNKIIIHNFFQCVVEVFFKLIQNYVTLWNNHEFAKLSKKLNENIIESELKIENKIKNQDIFFQN